MRLKICAAVVMAALPTLVSGGCSSASTEQVVPESAQVSDDGKVLTLKIVRGSNETIGVKAEERASEVLIDARLHRENDAAHNLAGHIAKVSVTLKSPLGGRTLKSSRGESIEIE